MKIMLECYCSIVWLSFLIILSEWTNGLSATNHKQRAIFSTPKIRVKKITLYLFTLLTRYYIHPSLRLFAGVLPAPFPHHPSYTPDGNTPVVLPYL